MDDRQTVPPHQPRQVMPYRNSQADQPLVTTQIPAVIGMGILTGLVMAVIGVAWTVWNVRIGMTVPPPTWIHWGFLILCTIAGLALIAALAMSNWRKGRRAVTAGICPVATVGISGPKPVP